MLQGKNFIRNIFMFFILPSLMFEKIYFKERRKIKENYGNFVKF